MSVVDCPCGHDCYADTAEEDRHFAEETLHWKQAEVVREAEKIGGVVADAIVSSVKATIARMEYGRNRFIERVLGRKPGELD